MKAILKAVLVAIMMLVSPIGAYAQLLRWAPEPPPSVLDPDPKPWWFGVGIGGVLVSHSGSFTTPVCDCRFSEGSGTTFTLHAEVGRKLFPALALSLRMSWFDLGAEAKTDITRMTVVLGQPDRIPLQYTRTLTTELGYLVLTPTLSLYPFEEGLYLSAGLTAGLSLKSTYRYEESLHSADYVYVENDASVVRVTEDEGDLPDPTSLRLGVRAALGYDLWLSYRTTLTPEVAYSSPLNDISAQPGWTSNLIKLSF